MRYTFVLLAIIFSQTVNAQSIEDPYFNTNEQVIKINTFEHDPLQKKAFQYFDNPCEDEVYLELKEIEIDKMSDRQFEVYKQKDQACQEYQKAQLQNEPANRTADSLENSTQALNTVYIISGVATLASVIYLFTI